MGAQILQLNFKFNVTRSEYEQAVSSLAGAFAEAADLRRKVLLMNEEDSEAGCIYLFDNESSLDTFLIGPLAAQVKDHPAISDLSVNKSEVMADGTAVTRGPV